MQPVMNIQVLADLIPETKTRVGVQFTLFKIFGLLPIKAPERAKGKLDTTFVDEELRVSRGDKGGSQQLSSMPGSMCNAWVAV